MNKRYWLLKTEPDTYSIYDLKRERVGVWDGVRNFQARNLLKSMEPGDLVFIYHSNIKNKGIYGVGEVFGEVFPDKSQFDSKGPYFDVRAKHNKPIWVSRKIKFKKILKNEVTLEKMKSEKSLKGLMVIEKGSRLSVQPVSKEHFETILRLGSLPSRNLNKK